MMARTISERQLRLLVANGIMENKPPEELYREVVAAYNKLGFTTSIATTFFLWEIERNHLDAKAYLDYAREMHDKDVEALKPIIGLAERWLRERPNVLSKPKKG